jgi:hypothetical protein
MARTMTCTTCTASHGYPLIRARAPVRVFNPNSWNTRYTQSKGGQEPILFSGCAALAQAHHRSWLRSADVWKVTSPPYQGDNITAYEHLCTNKNN